MSAQLPTPPAALGPIDHSPEALLLTCSVARHVLAVVSNRTLSPAQQVKALLCVAANIAAKVPDNQREAALTFFVQDAALRWHLATRHATPTLADHLAALDPVGSA